MRKRIVFLIVLILLISSSVALAQQSTDVGQIAIVGADGNISLYDMATQALTPVTSDASLNNPFRVYTWPTWSSDGQLAFFGTNADPNNFYTLGIFVRRLDGSVKGVYASPEEAFTYAYWSPGDCPNGDCRDLAILYTQATGGLAVRQVRAADKFTITELDQGGPFYWDYSPDGQFMLWARFGETLEIYDVAAGQISELLPDTQGLQQAVDWSPVDNRLLSALLNNDGSTSLVVLDGAERLELVAGLDQGVAFEWSPDGSQVAYLDLASGNLNVVDAITGANVGNPADRVLAFFWSPDATKIAYLTFAADTNRPGASRPLMQDAPPLQWNVYDVTAGQNSRLATFDFTSDMGYYLAFFDQFSRSHRFWSPDSRYLVYGELRSGQPVVSLLDVTAPNAAPQTIADGTIGIFSWN